MNLSSIHKFDRKSVFLCILLSIVTLTYYFIFWCQKQAKVINRLLPENPVPLALVYACYVLTTAGFLMLIPTTLYEGSAVISLFKDLIDMADGICLIVLTFKVRNQLHIIFESQKGETGWCHWFWTLFFSFFYLQFKINRLYTINPNITGETA